MRSVRRRVLREKHRERERERKLTRARTPVSCTRDIISADDTARLTITRRCRIANFTTLIIYGAHVVVACSRCGASARSCVSCSVGASAHTRTHFMHCPEESSSSSSVVPSGVCAKRVTADSANLSLGSRRTDAPPTSESLGNSGIVSRRHVESALSQRGRRKRQSRARTRRVPLPWISTCLSSAARRCRRKSTAREREREPERRRAWNSELTAKFLTKFGGCPRARTVPAFSMPVCRRYLSCRFFWGLPSLSSSPLAL